MADQTLGISIQSNDPGYWPGTIIVADVNDDGRDDVLIGYTKVEPNDHAFPLRVLLSDGNGFHDGTSTVFSGAAPVADGPSPYVYADLNGDHVKDLFIGNSGYDAAPWPGARNTFLLSTNGGLTDASSTLTSQPDFTHTLAYGDINGDGSIDIYQGSISTDGPSFLINDGHGQLTQDRTRLPDHIANTNRLNAETYTGSLLVDVNGDTKLDLVLGGMTDIAPSRVMLNDGSGHFYDGALLPPGPNPTSNNDAVTHIFTTDLNRDGHPDLVLNIAVDFYKSGYFQFLINDGTGHFTDETLARTISMPEVGTSGDYHWYANPTLADVNGDGQMDIVIQSGVNKPVLLNDGTGRFISMPDTYGTNFYGNVVPGEFNGDHVTDFFMWKGNSGGHEFLQLTYGVAPTTNQLGTVGNDGMSGTTGSDTMNGGSGDNVLVGLGGDDSLTAAGGNDRLQGGTGNDTLNGGEGNNVLYGDEGADQIVTGSGHNIVNGNKGDDVVYGHSTIGDWLLGGQGNDQIDAAASTGNNIINGNLGNDVVLGSPGADFLRGGQGDDVLNAGSGDDHLWGDRGNDTLTGGAGADTFHFAPNGGIDRITDFNVAEGDRVQIEGGATYAISSSGADTVIDLANGDRLTLVGVNLGPGDWLVAS